MQIIQDNRDFFEAVALDVKTAIRNGEMTLEDLGPEALERFMKARLERNKQLAARPDVIECVTRAIWEDARKR